MVVTDYLYRKFPHATSGQLTWARSRAVCSPAFACVAVRKLNLHKLLLMNNVELSMAISNYVPILEALSEEEVVLHGWKQDPPKAISDIFESIMGALFVEASAKSGQNVELAFEQATRDILDKVRRGVFDDDRVRGLLLFSLVEPALMFFMQSPGVKLSKPANTNLALEAQPSHGTTCCS